MLKHFSGLLSTGRKTTGVVREENTEGTGQLCALRVGEHQLVVLVKDGECGGKEAS